MVGTGLLDYQLLQKRQHARIQGAVIIAGEVVHAVERDRGLERVSTSSKPG